MLIDTHCHIHEVNYPLDIDDVMARAHHEGVSQMICVGTSEASSRAALEFASSHDGVFASIGVHPHDTKDGWTEISELAGPAVGSTNAHGKLVAVGEIGLDYFYSHSPHEVQIEALQSQIELALKYDLPIIFHVRDAFEDFWPILDNFHGIRGVLHSFTDTQASVEEGLKRGLYIGVNGISTFTKDESQKTMFSSIPLEKLLLETDAPFLTPVPFRGKVNEPAFVRTIAEYHSAIRQKSFDEIANATTANARALFAL
ncbi:MAG TPA: TatD family hydrolase [Candidatus Saccharimonadales bacterium]|nr:TatD family hydrolase [Candidatus Saccharimonadales bacterium]